MRRRGPADCSPEEEFAEAQELVVGPVQFVAAADAVVVNKDLALCLDLGAGLVPLRLSASACRDGFSSSNVGVLRHDWPVFVNVLKASCCWLPPVFVL